MLQSSLVQEFGFDQLVSGGPAGGGSANGFIGSPSITTAA
jgi:hypothetical protein